MYHVYKQSRKLLLQGNFGSCISQSESIQIRTIWNFPEPRLKKERKKKILNIVGDLLNRYNHNHSHWLWEKFCLSSCYTQTSLNYVKYIDTETNIVLQSFNGFFILINERTLFALCGALLMWHRAFQNHSLAGLESFPFTIFVSRIKTNSIGAQSSQPL